MLGWAGRVRPGNFARRAADHPPLKKKRPGTGESRAVGYWTIEGQTEKTQCEFYCLGLS